MVGGEIGEGDANRFGRIDALLDLHEKTGGADCILAVAAGDS